MALLLNEMVDYSPKIRAIGKNKTTISRYPLNGSTFVSGQAEPEFVINCRRPNKWEDIPNAYFSFDMNKTDASGASLASIGAIALINRQTVETDLSTQFSKNDQHNMLFAIKSCEEFSQELMDGQFRVAYGTSANDASGVSLSASSGNTPRYSVPFCLCGLSHQFLYMGGQENIRIKMNIESALTALIGTGVLVSSSVTISNLALIIDEYELEPEDNMKLVNSFPNRT